MPISKNKKINKFILLNPPTGIYDRTDRCQSPIEEEGIEMIRPPMDLAYMGAMVEKAGGKAVIKDYPAEKKNFADFKKDLYEIKPDVLILSVTTPTLDQDFKCCTIAKKINPDIITIAKGAHFYEFDKKVLTQTPDLDIVIRGESEPAVYEIAQGKAYKSIKGISYRHGKMIFRNGERPFIDNLDSLPFPARHLLDNNLYHFSDTGKPYALILSGRGCPGGCIFCLVGKVSGRKLRTRSVQSIIKEIEMCVKDYNIKTFLFRADTFTWNKKWVLDFCQDILDRKLKIRWGTNSRVDTLDEEMVRIMKKAGCDVIGFGIESGSQEILNKVGKRTTLQQSRKAVELCDKYDMKTLLFFILGLPWENKKTIEETLNFAKALPGTFYNFSIAYPFPGTELANIVQENNLMAKHSLFGYNYGNPVVKTFYLSNEELQYYRKKALKELYFRPSYIFKVLRQIRTFNELKNYFHAGFVKVQRLVRIN